MRVTPSGGLWIERIFLGGVLFTNPWGSCYVNRLGGAIGLDEMTKSSSELSKHILGHTLSSNRPFRSLTSENKTAVGRPLRNICAPPQLATILSYK